LSESDALFLDDFGEDLLIVLTLIANDETKMEMPFGKDGRLAWAMEQCIRREYIRAPPGEYD